MAQYQKGKRNATSWRFSGVIVALYALALVAGALAVRGVAAAPGAQASSPAADLVLPVITPVEPSPISLPTHIVELALTRGESGEPGVALRALYRLHNDGKEPATVTLRIPVAAASNFELSVDGEALVAQPAADGALVATVAVGVDAPVTVELVYRAGLGDALLPTVRYPAARLRAWPGQISLRAEVQPDASIPPASWLRVAPAGWAYAPPGVTSDPAAEWLFDGDLPEEIVIQFVRPETWQQVQQAEQAAVAGAPLSNFATLGDVVGVLAEAARAGNSAAAERYYGQAVAAYSTGLRQGEAAGASVQELAGLHAGLATLYRARVVGADGATNVHYAELMAAEASAALPGIMADDPKRIVLDRWQAEGLRLLLADTRRRGDVAGALALIDRLAASEAGMANADYLARERKALIVQQALALLEQGDRAAALALAGDALVDPALQPPGDSQSLFTRWSAAAAMTDAGIDLRIEAMAQTDQIEAARAQLQAIVQAWKSQPATRGSALELQELAAGNGEGTPGFRLTLHLPNGATGVALAEALPARADWALLRSLLAQLGPKLDSKTNGVRQQVHLSQPIDLRTAGGQWAAMAQSLEDQAATFEAQAGSTAVGEGATLDASLQARIRATNYRHVAQVWRHLARDSHVELSLHAAGSLGDAARTWLVTVDSPPQMLDVEVESLNSGRLALAVAGLGVVLVGLAGLLWRLLA